GRLKGHRSPVWSLAFSADGKTLASGSFDWTAKLWETTTGLNLATLEPHASTVVQVAFAPDGQTLATGGAFGTLKLCAARAPPRTLPPAFAPAARPPEKGRGPLRVEAPGNAGDIGQLIAALGARTRTAGLGLPPNLVTGRPAGEEEPW